LTILRADTLDEAIKLVNDNPYGNGTAIFTRSGAAARKYLFDSSSFLLHSPSTTDPFVKVRYGD
jgi:acyl-CoA reductase-like NAD-dependent aldehyde dehydrogenase